MTKRASLRMRGFALLLAAAACKPTVAPPSPPPPPPPGAPVVTAGRDSTLPVGSSYSLSASFTDTASNSSPWNYEIAWGDGAKNDGTKTNIAPITGTHVYNTEGSFKVTVTVTNAQNKSGNGSLTIETTPPVILAAGDIGDCGRPNDDSTGALLDHLAGTVMPLGDVAYETGTPDEFQNCFGKAWGRVKARMRPVPGNHDYYCTAAQGCSTPGAGYFGYFGAAAGDPTKGYYDFTLGSWLVIVINTGTEHITDYAVGSPQEQWLRRELAANSGKCVVAMWHHPRFSTIKDRVPIRADVKPLWDALYEYGADLVLNGHDHVYERFAPQNPDGVADAAFGIRQFTVGTGGGESLYAFDSIPPGSNVQVRNNVTNGVLQLTLHNTSYDWKFIPAPGFGSYTDSGTGNCHGKPQ